MSDRRSPLVSDPGPTSGTPQAVVLAVDVGDGDGAGWCCSPLEQPATTAKATITSTSPRTEPPRLELTRGIAYRSALLAEAESRHRSPDQPNLPRIARKRHARPTRKPPLARADGGCSRTYRRRIRDRGLAPMPPPSTASPSIGRDCPHHQWGRNLHTGCITNPRINHMDRLASRRWRISPRSDRWAYQQAAPPPRVLALPDNSRHVARHVPPQRLGNPGTCLRGGTNSLGSVLDGGNSWRNGRGRYSARADHRRPPRTSRHPNSGRRNSGSVLPRWTRRPYADRYSTAPA